MFQHIPDPFQIPTVITLHGKRTISQIAFPVSCLQYFLSHTVITLQDRHLCTFFCRGYGCHHSGSTAADHTDLFFHLHHLYSEF